jgi:hypothetical protein
MKECDNSTRKNTYKQQLHIVHKSSNNVWNLITKTVTTLQHFAALHHTSPNYTSLHFATLHHTSPNYTSLHFATLHHTSPNYTSLHFTQLHFTTLYPTTLRYTSPHFTQLHFTTLHPTPLHYTSLHFTTLHPVTLHYTYRHFTGEFAPVRITKSQWESEVMASRILNLAVPPVESTEQGAGWATQRGFWKIEEFFWHC